MTRRVPDQAGRLVGCTGLGLRVGVVPLPNTPVTPVDNRHPVARTNTHVQSW